MAQTLSWTALTQYYANLTTINNEAEHKGDHSINPIKFEVEYDTRDDDWYQLKDLTVRELLKLAHSIGVDGDHSGEEAGAVEEEEEEEWESDSDDDDDDADASGKKKGKKGKKGKKKKDKKNKLWIEFLRRAFVGTMDDDDLKKL
ncbi:hypothetical protein NLG97_g11366 [Lecanicillium saksenae]|uniref:Uncharacterized protein n=1 Tax=Lecanicillium saksenae TaxID=468837 RepID=A0ACC1QDA7_9HYPO|nr:hypothetical protein NLG97_g11366 [Lecanicillium saksenae]